MMIDTTQVRTNWNDNRPLLSQTEEAYGVERKGKGGEQGVFSSLCVDDEADDNHVATKRASNRHSEKYLLQETEARQKRCGPV